MVRVSVLGAASSLGRGILGTLAERGFPVSEVVALASGRAVGGEVSFGERRVLRLAAQERHAFSAGEVVFAARLDSGVHLRRALEAGARVVDSSGWSAADPAVPLVVPELNGAVLDGAGNLVASPSAAAIFLALVLAPLAARAGLERVVVVSHEPVSGLGQAAMDELFAQTRGVFVNEAPPPEQFPKPIAFNLLPQVGEVSEEGGETEGEAALAGEASRLLGGVPVSASAVRVPVFVGLSLSVHALFSRPLSVAEARETLRESPGLALLDRREEGGYATPAEVAGEDAVHVSRLRADPAWPGALALWCVGDDLRKGGALNAVQIAERWLGLAGPVGDPEEGAGSS